MRVNPAVAYQAEQMEFGLFFFDLLHGLEQDLVFHKFAGADGAGNKGEVLVDNLASA